MLSLASPPPKWTRKQACLGSAGTAELWPWPMAAQSRQGYKGKEPGTHTAIQTSPCPGVNALSVLTTPLRLAKEGRS